MGRLPPISPIIPCFDDDKAHFLRVFSEETQEPSSILSPFDIARFYNNDTAAPSMRRGIRIEAHSYNKSKETTVEEAEENLFRKAYETEEKYAVLPYAVRRQAAYIACRNRRGWPNIALMHPNMVERLFQLEPPLADIRYVDPDFPRIENSDRIGRWQRVGMIPKFEYKNNHNCFISSGPMVFSSSDLPENVCYVSMNLKRLDYPAAFLSRNDKLYLVEPEDTESAKTSYYITKITFTD